MKAAQKKTFQPYAADSAEDEDDEMYKGKCHKN